MRASNLPFSHFKTKRLPFCAFASPFFLHMNFQGTRAPGRPQGKAWAGSPVHLGPPYPSLWDFFCVRICPACFGRSDTAIRASPHENCLANPKSTLFAERPRRRRRCQRRDPRPRNSVAPRCFRHSFKLLCDASAPVSMLPLRLDASSPSRRSLCFRFLFRSPRSFLLPVSSKFRSPRSRALFLKLPHSSKLPLGSPFLDAQLFDDHRCGLCQMSRSALQTPLI